MNALPEQTPEKKKSSFYTFATIVIVIITTGSLYRNLAPQISSSLAEWSLRQEFGDSIKKCVEQKESTLNGKKVIGIEYSCAIQTASTIYDKDAKKAIDLCMIYNPLFDIQLNRSYSSTNPDDLWAQKNENIAKGSCKSSIENLLNKAEIQSPTPEIIPTQQVLEGTGNTQVQTTNTPEITPEPSTSQSISTTSTSLTNTKFKYSLTKLASDKALTDSPENVTIQDKNGGLLLNIKIINTKLSLKGYVDYFAKLNKDTQDLEPAESLPVGGVSGLTMATLDSYKDDQDTYTFSKDFPVHTFVFIEHKGIKYQFEMPESLGHRGMEILDSIQFST